jgi:hypothetical protein
VHRPVRVAGGEQLGQLSGVRSSRCAGAATTTGQHR